MHKTPRTETLDFPVRWSGPEVYVTTEFGVTQDEDLSGRPVLCPDAFTVTFRVYPNINADPMELLWTEKNVPQELGEAIWQKLNEVYSERRDR